jgi:hypothetical protein
VNQQITTVGFRPEANGIVERLNAEIKRPEANGIVVNARQVQNRWSKSLPLVQRILNATVQSTTGCAPAEMVFGGLVSLNRDLIVSREVSTDSSLIQCSEYVRELREMQNNIVAASQRHMATVLDRRVEAAQLEDLGSSTDRTSGNSSIRDCNSGEMDWTLLLSHQSHRIIGILMKFLRSDLRQFR